MPEDTKKKPNITPVLFSIGFILFIVGFILLYFVDKNAQNLFGFLSPFVLVLGIILITLSFVF